MKTVIGVGCNLRTSSARVVKNVSDRHLRKNKHKSAEPLPTQKKTQKATTSHFEPLKSLHKPLLEKRKSSHYQHFAIGQGLDMITARSSSTAHKRVACSTRSSKCPTRAEWSYPSTHHLLLAFFRTSAQPLASDWHRCRLPPLRLRFSLGLQATRCKPRLPIIILSGPTCRALFQSILAHVRTMLNQ